MAINAAHRYYAEILRALDQNQMVEVQNHQIWTEINEEVMAPAVNLGLERIRAPVETAESLVALQNERNGYETVPSDWKRYLLGYWLWFGQGCQTVMLKEKGLRVKFQSRAAQLEIRIVKTMELASAKLAGVRAEKQAITNEKNRVQGEKENLARQVGEKNGEIRRLTDERDQLIRERDVANESLRQKTEEKANTERQLEGVQKMLEETTGERDILQERITPLEIEHAALTERQNALTRDLDRIAQTCRESNTQLLRCQNSNQQLTASLKELAAEAQKQVEEIEKLKTTVLQHQIKIREKESELTALRNRDTKIVYASMIVIGMLAIVFAALPRMYQAQL